MISFFSKEKALARKHRKLQKRLYNMYAQSPDRRYTAQQLAELDTPEAVRILLGRFEKRTNNHTIDNEEKTDVKDLLVNMGTRVIDLAIEHLKGGAHNVNWPLRVLSEYLEPEALGEILAELLNEEDLEYGRNPERKEELVRVAADHKGDKLGQALARFLEDENEPIRWLTVDAIFKGGHKVSTEPIMRMLAGEEESQRVVALILDHVVETDWTVKGFKAKIEENLPDGYAITRSGTIRRRG